MQHNSLRHSLSIAERSFSKVILAPAVARTSFRWICFCLAASSIHFVRMSWVSGQLPLTCRTIDTAVINILLTSYHEGAHCAEAMALAVFLPSLLRVSSFKCLLLCNLQRRALEGLKTIPMLPQVPCAIAVGIPPPGRRLISLRNSQKPLGNPCLDLSSSKCCNPKPEADPSSLGPSAGRLVQKSTANFTGSMHPVYVMQTAENLGGKLISTPYEANPPLAHNAHANEISANFSRTELHLRGHAGLAH